jgi:hypothetical protein
MATLSPMTKLDAVNICLSSMGEPHVNSLDTAAIDAQIASDVIDELSRSVQIRGFNWNREFTSLSPDISGYINLPENTLKVDSIESSKLTNVVQRGQRLYNVDDGTYTFTEAVRVGLTVLLDFELLPSAARDYIACSAALVNQERVLGSMLLDKFLQQRAQQAWTELQRDELNNADPNILRDNWSVYGTIQRGWFRRGGFLS